MRDLVDLSGDAMLGRLVNIGLRAARRVGTGLGLVNEIRELHPEAPLDAIGHAAQIVGSGINAAVIHNAGGVAGALDLSVMPVAPNAFFTGGETARVTAFADVSFEAFDRQNPDQPHQERTWDVRVDCSESYTFQDLIDCIEQQFETYQERGPDITLNDYTNIQINIFFMAKRF